MIGTATKLTLDRGCFHRQDILGSFQCAALASASIHVVKLIHHYTTAEGLLGIISSGKMFFTDTLYLNDASEVRYGLQVCWDAAFDILDDLKASSAETQVIMGALNANPPDYGLNTYVACFCSSSDLLSQWRGYGAAGVGGYCLSFDKDQLEDIGRNPDNRPESQSFVAKEIEYDPAVQRQGVKNALKRYINDCFASDAVWGGLARVYKQAHAGTQWVPQEPRLQGGG